MKGKAQLENMKFTPESFREMVILFQKSRVVLTAFELGLFSVLGENGKSSKEIARALKTDTRATDRLMNALCALGLLKKKDNKFSNTEFTGKYLVADKADYLPGLMHSVNLWDTWSTLTEAVRRGTSVAIPEVNKRGKKWLEAFIAAMHDRAKKPATAVVALLNLDGIKRVLDVGGGSGAYAMAFVRAIPGCTATIFDLPSVIPITKRYIKNEGLAGRITTASGDYTSDDIGKGFDLVFLSAIIHSNPPVANRKLIQKCAKALNPNGQVVVQDFIISDDRTSPFMPALFALNMLVGTEAGDTYTESEVSQWMRNAGLMHITRIDTPFATSLITGS